MNKNKLTFDKFKNRMNDAYKTSNFFDSQHMIEELKKNYADKQIISFINKELKLRKNNAKALEEAESKLSDKFHPRDYHKWEDALNYVKHKYERGEYVLTNKYQEFRIGKISQLTKKGYKVFFGRKIGTCEDISFSQIVCLAQNIEKLKEVFSEKK